MSRFWNDITVDHVYSAKMDLRYVRLIGHFSQDVHLELKYDLINHTYILMKDGVLVGDTISVVRIVHWYNGLLSEARRNSD